MILVLMADNEKTFVGLAADGKCVKKENFPRIPGERVDLLKEIDKIISPENIEGVIVYIGPGPFSGIRVAVAIANALSFSLNTTIAGVKSVADVDNLLARGLEILKMGSSEPVIPYYDKAPNITKPKKA